LFVQVTATLQSNLRAALAVPGVVDRYELASSPPRRVSTLLVTLSCDAALVTHDDAGRFMQAFSIALNEPELM
jgi:hypothetical protein